MRSTTPSNGSGGAHYLPIGLVDIELSTPPTELVDDTTIFLLGPDQEGSPSAVLKVARGLLGTAELRTQRRVLSELAIHPGLDGEWRELLPRVLAFDERAEATLSVESFRPGIDLAEALACQPDRVEELTATALRAIAPLHRQDDHVRRRRQRDHVVAMARRTPGRPGRHVPPAGSRSGRAGEPALPDAAARRPRVAYAGGLDPWQLHPR